jgi:hypothetical protein
MTRLDGLESVQARNEPVGSFAKTYGNLKRPLRGLLGMRRRGSGNRDPSGRVLLEMTVRYSGPRYLRPVRVPDGTGGRPSCRQPKSR